MKLKILTLRKSGMKITGNPIYISPNCWFDVVDYGLIHLNNKVVLSSNVSILVHDFSISRIKDALTNKTNVPEIMIQRKVYIGENSFIGFGSTLLPGTHIGKNSIVGAGAIVRGNFPDNSIITGNPAKITWNSLEWGKKKLQKIKI